MSVDLLPLGLGDGLVLRGRKVARPEIDTSEIIAEFQWHFPMDCQWHFPTAFHVFSGISRRIVTFPVDLTGNAQWIFSGMFQWKCTFVISGV